MKNNTSKLIITILTITTILAMLIGLYIHVFRGFTFFGFGRSNNDSVTDTLTFEGSVSSLDIKSDFANISILPGNGPLTVSYNMPKDQVPDIAFTNGTLTILPKKGVRILANNWGSDYKISITVPEGTELSSVKLDVDAGNINMSDLNAKNVSIDADAGNVNVSDVTADIFKVGADAGNLDLDNITANEMDLDTDAGNVDVRNCSLSSLIVDLDAGNLEIHKSVIDVINADTDMGNIESFDSEIRSGTCTTDMGDIDLQGDIGNVSCKTSLGKVR